MFMYKRSTLILLLQIIFASAMLSQTSGKAEKPAEAENLEGTWVIDLRPEPDAEPYLKDFVVKLKKNGAFSGEFYETKFENGVINTSWDRIYFAFSTKDQSSSYYHSGYLEGDRVYGLTYSPERNFAAPWTGEKKLE
jgi:hypothetical protein